MDPDCIEEDAPILEPEAYGMGVMEPSLVWDLGSDEAEVECEDDPVVTSAAPIVVEVTDECVDELTTEEVETIPPKPMVVEVTDECVDEFTTEEVETLPPAPPAPVIVTDEECEDPIVTTQAPAPIVVTDECEDEDAAGLDSNPFLNFHIEKAEAEEALVFYDENPAEDIEECDDY